MGRDDPERTQIVVGVCVLVAGGEPSERLPAVGASRVGVGGTGIDGTGVDGTGVDGTGEGAAG